MVTRRLGVSNITRPTSTVTPRRRSSSPLSMRYAKAKLFLPASVAPAQSVTIIQRGKPERLGALLVTRRISWSVTLPSWYTRWPLRVLLPLSTCPHTTMRTLGLASEAAAAAASSSDISSMPMAAPCPSKISNESAVIAAVPPFLPDTLGLLGLAKDFNDSGSTRGLPGAMRQPSSPQSSA